MSVAYERTGDLGTVTLSAPPLNLFDSALASGLEEALGQAAQDSPRALLVRAEGKVFTGGVDVHEFDGLSVDDARALAERLLGITHAVEDLPFPTVACVHGLCLTAGFELSLACDLIFASRSAQFGLVEIVVGVTPFMGGTQRVAERAGPARARELVMSGELYPAETLERWNVVNRVIADDDLEAETEEFARRLAAGPTLANAATKRIVRAATDGGTRAADEATPGIAAPLYDTEDLKGGVSSFLQDGPGKAVYKGR